MSNIVELPDYKILKQEIREFREKLEAYYFDHDYLAFTVCKNIEMEYRLEFGALEYKLYELYCMYHRLRRKRALIQEKINRQEKIDEKILEMTLDQEFAEYKQKLNEKMSDINKAIKRKNGKFLSEDDEKNLNDLYRKLVKKLHPDLNKHLTDEAMDLYDSVITAYKAGDYKSLQIIYEIVELNRPNDLEDDSLQGMKLERDRLENLVSTIEMKIQTLRESFPYSARIYLEDDSEKSAKKKELNLQIGSYKEAIQTIEEYLKKSLGERNE